MRKETGVKGGVTLFRGTGTAAYEYLESHPLDFGRLLPRVRGPRWRWTTAA